MKRKNPFCIGYGPYEGTCENRAGTAWGPYWCERCNKIRLETIDRSLQEFIQSFEKKEIS